MTEQLVIPSHINSLADYLEEIFKKFSNKPAFSSLGQAVSFSEMDEMSAQFGAWLLAKGNLKPGDRIAIQLPNLLQNPIAVYGALRAGLVVVNTNPLYTPSEMAHQFSDSGAKALVILEDFVGKFEEIKSKTQIETVIVTSAPQMLSRQKLMANYPCLMQVLEEGKELTLPARPAISLDDTCVLQYTGGTTGVSKGAELTHRNIYTNSIQITARLGKAFIEGEEIIVCPLPLYHIYAFTVCMMALFAKGAMCVLIPNPRDMNAFVEQIKPHKFSALAGLNTLFMGLCAHPDFPSLDFSKLKLTISGGTALTTSVAELWLKTTGCTITEGYGLSETAPVLAFNEPGAEHIGTVGRPAPCTDIQLLDENDEPVADGKEGQIAAKGPQVMKGYWQRPEETAKVMTKDGYFKTGDVGIRMSDGCIKIVDRLKDLIIVSGFNVYPNEIEDALTKHDGVMEAAVIGKPDAKTGERVCAFVTCDGSLDKDSVIAHCRKLLTGYKIPKELHVIDELPKSAVGKILRRELR